MVLWILATPDCFRSIALRFGKTGVLHYHYKKIITALSEMADTYVKWASQEERVVVVAVVERRTGFPGVVGAIDGCHIEISTPTEESNRYFNRHHDHFVVLQAVADETLLFRDVNVGNLGPHMIPGYLGVLCLLSYWRTQSATFPVMNVSWEMKIYRLIG